MMEEKKDSHFTLPYQYRSALDMLAPRTNGDEVDIKPSTSSETATLSDAYDTPEGK